MTQTLWIVIVVVAVLIVLAVVLGLVLRRSRRISLREPEKREELPPRGGSYKAEGGIVFSAGGEAPAPPRRTDPSPREHIADSRTAAPDSAPPAAAPPAPEAPAAPPAGPRPARRTAPSARSD